MNKELRESILKSLKEGIRFDGRKLDEFRKIEVETGSINTAEGSAHVKIGNTEVLAGIKLQIEEPYPDTPDEGMMMVGMELLPLANPEFESGPPTEEAIEISRVIDRGIRESKCIDMKKLNVKKGEKSWAVMVDIAPINDAGNLLDAGSLAAILALKNTTMPEFDGEKIDYKKKTSKKLPLGKLPVSVTIAKIGDYFIVDPSSEEEEALDAKLTVASLDDGTLCAMQKAGYKPLSEDDIMKMIDMSLKAAKKLRVYHEKA
ncbi:exosome complex protein Rrp42 [Candidatus Woesearchaeota archaeon]|nr:MAG: exosome complex protein Rrp42 [Candidatus Woesearchaeota archaeon]